MSGSDSGGDKSGGGDGDNTPYENEQNGEEGVEK